MNFQIEMNQSFSKNSNFTPFGQRKHLVSSSNELIFNTDYYPFGMLMPGRGSGSPEYSYGFNGMEKDDEIKGVANSYDFGARMHDPRTGRFFAVDPKAAYYPFMSTYCFAANNPVYFTDENGEGPKKPKNSRVAWAIYGISKVTYKSIIASNNTSIREVEKWALEERGYDKSTPWKLKGAIGEGLVYSALNGKFDELHSTNGVGFNISLQGRTASTNSSNSDVLLEFEVGSFNQGTRLLVQRVQLNWNSSDGNEYSENYYADIGLFELSDTETFKFQFEVKTLTPRTDKKGMRGNIRALKRGLNQLDGRSDDHTAVLTTDKQAYMNIYNASQKGSRSAQNFISMVDDFIDDGGKLMLMENLNQISYDRVGEIKEKIVEIDNECYEF